MRTLLLAISFSFFTSLFGQTQKNFAIFKTEDFTNTNSKTSSKTEKISFDSSLDFNFYRQHFYIPYYFPDILIDLSHKSESVTVWRDTAVSKNYESNWTHTFKYDEKSRVTDYGFSGCVICSNLPYTIKLFYNELDEVVKMEKFYSLEIPTKEAMVTKTLSIPPVPVETYIFYYDTKGDIIQLDYFINKILSKRIRKT